MVLPAVLVFVAATLVGESSAAMPDGMKPASSNPVLLGAQEQDFPGIDVWVLVALGILEAIAGGALVWMALAVRRRDRRSVENSPDFSDRGPPRDEESRSIGRVIGLTPFPVMVLDEKGSFLWMNAAGERAFGYEGGRCRGRRLSDLLHPDDRQRIQDMFLLRLANDRHEPAPLRLRAADGSWRWFQGWSQGYTNSKGERRLLAASWDITAQLEAAEALRASEERFRSLASHSPDLVAEYDEDGRFTYANPRWKSELGFDPEELVGTDSLALGLPEDLPRMHEDLRWALSPQGLGHAGRTLYRVRAADGGVHWMELRGSGYADSSGRRRLVLTLRDAAQQVSLAQAREQLVSLLDRSHELVAIMDSGGRMSFLNQSGRALVGISPDATLSDRSIADLVPREYRPLLVDLILPAAIRDGGFSGTFSLCHQESGEWIPVQLEAAAIPDTNNPSRIGVGLILRDLRLEQEQREERERLRSRLDAFQKLETLRDVAGGVAHDFNNMLGIILGNISMARNQTPRPSLDVLLGSAEDAALRATEVVKSLLAYGGGRPQKVSRFRLSEIARQACLSGRLGRLDSARIDWDLDPGDPVVAADLEQLKLLLDHLLQNAVEAVTPNGGGISVRSDSVVLRRQDISRLHLPLEAAPGLFARLEVRDSGPGVAGEVLQKMFDPFFSTKSIGRGLGLSAVMGIARQAGGAIDLETGPDTGTALAIFLPAAERRARGSREARIDRDKADRCVLLVDDEPEFMQLLGYALEGEGYTAISALGSEEAWRRFLDARLDLVAAVIGVRLPAADGIQIFRRMRRAHPKLPLVLSSPHGEEPVLREWIGGSAEFLAKPFVPEELLCLLERIQQPPGLSDS